MFFDYIMKCTYPGCANQVVNIALEMCQECVNKVIEFEEQLDKWLDANYPQYVLDDVIGWYCKCSSFKCQRDCLDEKPFIQGCICCPCNLKLDYISNRIDGKTMPSHVWMKNLTCISELEN